MPYTTHWEKRGVTWTYRGIVTGDEVLKSNQEIYGDSRFDQLKFQLIDATGVERFELTEEDMVILAACDKAAALTNETVKVAVAATDEVIEQLSAFYKEENDDSPWEQKTFSTIEQARAWAVL